MIRTRFWLFLVSLVALMPCSALALQENFQPIQSVDDAVEAMMERIGATAGSLAISREGELVYSRVYGHCDRRGRQAMNTNNIMRIASGSKPFTAAAIYKLIERGDISESTLIYEYLGIQPTKELADPRVKTITVKNLLDHEGGWDRDTTFDPLYRTHEIKRTLKVSRMKKHHIVRYMWDRPLQSEPGMEEHYSNFGFLLLGLVIEKATGKSYIESIRELITEPLGIENIAISSEVKRNRTSREVYYPADNKLNLHLRDAAGGLATNSESLCKFMGAYWLTGVKRRSFRNRYYYQFGSHPHTTTAILEQRVDGIDFAVLLNRRQEDSYDADNEDFRTKFNDVLDQAKSKLGK